MKKLVARLALVSFAFTASIAMSTLPAAAEYRPPFDLDAYCLSDDVVCNEPWIELTPPDPLRETCLLEDDEGNCEFPLTVRKAWICYDHQRDWYGPDGMIAAIHGEDDDICMTTGIGEGHRPFSESFPGWTHPRDYEALVMREVLVPCVTALRAREGIDEPVTEESLRLNPLLEDAINGMVSTLKPLPENLHQDLLRAFLAQCTSSIGEN